MWFTFAVKTCRKTCLPRVNLRQINLLRCYLHPNEQPVVFILCMLCHFTAHWWFYIYRACAKTSIGTFITPEKCKRFSVTNHFRTSTPKRAKRWQTHFGFDYRITSYMTIACYCIAEITGGPRIGIVYDYLCRLNFGPEVWEGIWRAQ